MDWFRLFSVLFRLETKHKNKHPPFDCSDSQILDDEVSNWASAADKAVGTDRTQQKERERF